MTMVGIVDCYSMELREIFCFCCFEKQVSVTSKENSARKESIVNEVRFVELFCFFAAETVICSASGGTRPERHNGSRNY